MARSHMARFCLLQSGYFRPATFAYMGTPGVEGAPRREIRQICHLSTQKYLLGRYIRIRVRDGCEQRCRIRVPGSPEEGFLSCQLNDLSGIRAPDCGDLAGTAIRDSDVVQHGIALAEMRSRRCRHRDPSPCPAVCPLVLRSDHRHPGASFRDHIEDGARAQRQPAHPQAGRSPRSALPAAQPPSASPTC